MIIIVGNMLTILNKLGLVVMTLTHKDVPIVKTILTYWERVQVVLSNDAGVVAILLEFFREGPLALIECRVVILLEPVDMAVLRGEHYGTCRAIK